MARRRRSRRVSRRKGYVISDKEVDGVVKAREERKPLSVGEQHVLAVIEEEHFGQDQLTLGPSVELADCIVPETQQF